MNDLENVRRLWRLRQIARGKDELDVSELEREFLRFSRYAPPRSLVVRKPALYMLEGDERKQYVAAATILGLPKQIPEAVDIAGADGSGTDLDTVILFSLKQSQAGLAAASRLFLMPIIEKAYIDGTRMISDFAVHDALAGRVRCVRGQLDLKEAHIFPERFSHGPYELKLTLETPTEILSRYRTLTQAISELRANPEQILKNAERLGTITQLGHDLRSEIGALMRYECSPDELSAPSDECVIRLKESLCYFLYSQMSGKNAVVFFGANPFQKEPRDLAVIDGSKSQYALQELVLMGFYDPSEAILVQRIADLRTTFDNARRGMAEGFSSIEYVINKLETARTGIAGIVNPEIRRKSALALPAEVLELAVYPSQDHAVLHELLPHLSWSAAMHRYHNTEAFIKGFKAAETEGQQTILKEIGQSLLLSNQQNIDVNLWLYAHHRATVEEAGLSFIERSHSLTNE